MKALAVAIKEIRQIFRDRRTLSILLFVPAFFLLLYGYALNFDIRNVPLAVQDNDRSSASRRVISAFVQSGYFDLVQDVLRADFVGEVADEEEVVIAGAFDFVVVGGFAVQIGTALLGCETPCQIWGIILQTRFVGLRIGG